MAPAAAAAAASRPAAGLSTAALSAAQGSQRDSANRSPSPSMRRPFFPPSGVARRGVAELPPEPEGGPGAERMFPVLIGGYRPLTPFSDDEVNNLSPHQRARYRAVSERTGFRDARDPATTELEPEPELQPQRPDGTLAGLEIEEQDPALATVKQFLREVPVFTQLTEYSFTKVARELELRHYSCGEYIVEQGKEGVAFYIITSGRVGFVIGGIAVAACSPTSGGGKMDVVGQMSIPVHHEVGARECFGHISLLNESNLCAASAVVVSPEGASCYALPKNALSPAFCFRLLYPLLRSMLGRLIAEADDDGSGDLDKDEVMQLLATLGFADVPAPYIEGIWGEFDEQDRGALDADSVAAMVEVLAAERRARDAILEDMGDDAGGQTVWHSSKGQMTKKQTSLATKLRARLNSRKPSANGGADSSVVAPAASTVPAELKEVYTGPRAQEMERVREIFLLSDADRSGALDKAEVSHHVDQVLLTRHSTLY